MIIENSRESVDPIQTGTVIRAKIETLITLEGGRGGLGERAAEEVI